MAAPRATQFIALRNLARGSHLHHHGSHHQVRALHMTGPATYASRVLTQQERSTANFPSDTAGLRAECKRRQIDASGSKHDLVSRLNAHELIRSRAFSTAAIEAENSSKRPTATSGKESTTTKVRHFNTSRALKAVNDTSTIDFAFFPTFNPADAASDEEAILRVPILPTVTSTAPSTTTLDPHMTETAAEAAVMKPQILHVSGVDHVFLPMAELTDDHAQHVDFHELAERFKENLEGLKIPVEEQVGIVRQVLGDLVDDVLGTGAAGKGRRGTIIPSG